MSQVAEDFYKTISSEFDRRSFSNITELTPRYSTDIILSVALGFKANSLTDPDSSYRKLGKKFFMPTISRGF